MKAKPLASLTLLTFPTPPSLGEISMKDVLKIWLTFWGLSTLYVLIIACLIGVILTTLHVLEITSDFKVLLPAYVGFTSLVWFLLTPLILKRSLKQLVVISRK